MYFFCDFRFTLHNSKYKKKDIYHVTWFLGTLYDFTWNIKKYIYHFYVTFYNFFDFWHLTCELFLLFTTLDKRNQNNDIYHFMLNLL